MNKELNAFWDMDGVLFKYERNDYVGEYPAYASPKYFENRPIDVIAYEMFNSMHSNNNINGLYILSRGSSHLPDEEVRMRTIIDKKTNIRNQIPWFNIDNTIISNDAKVEAFIERFGRVPTKTDFLIDDFNVNLTSWSAAGGSAIKYVNGVNTANSYAGPKLIDGKLVDVPCGEEILYGRLKLSIES